MSRVPATVPVDLVVESLIRPIGMWTAHPRFGWEVGGDHRQVAYELLVSDPDGVVVGETGRVDDASSVLVEIPDTTLSSRTRYSWRVRVWLDSGDVTEWAESWFETTILDPLDWRAVWAVPEQVMPVRESDVSKVDTPDPREWLRPAPLVRQTFEVETVPERGRLYVSAHGVYEIRVNGVVVSDDVLSPGWDAYPQRLSFLTYDVTELLCVGQNVVAVMLSDGWWSGYSFAGQVDYGDQVAVIWQLEGDRVPIAASSLSAVASVGGVRYGDIFVGECFDARLDQPGWDSVGFDDGEWVGVESGGGIVTGLVPFVGEPVRRVAELAAVRVFADGAGDTVVDFGQNIAGRVRLSAEGAAGTEIRIEHTEVLDRDGTFFPQMRDGLRNQTDVWVLAGSGRETFEPRFTFHAFRYARITGYPGRLAPEDVIALAVSSDLTATGSFTTDHAGINQLHSNVVWTQRSNFLSIPTDCPHRERAGWTGDCQIFAPSATNNMDVRLFFTRWLANVRAEQFADGQIPVIVPNLPSNQRLKDPFCLADSCAGWGDAITIVPLVLYERYGDLRALEENYEAMRRWVDYCRRTAANPGRPEGYGDWLMPSTVPFGGDDLYQSVLVAGRLTTKLVAAMFFAASVANLAKVATILGDQTVADEMSRLSIEIREAFAEEYVTADGRLECGLQGMYVLALAFDLIPADRIDSARRHLVELIERADFHLDVGILSAPYLLDVLVSAGRSDLAYRLLLQETAPSWLSQVALGATTVWESFNGMAEDGQPDILSFNHYAFASVDDWLYRHVAGIQTVEPGYRRFRIAPDLSSPFGLVDASIRTPRGPIRSLVRRRGDETVVSVSVPPNSEGVLSLPGSPDRVVGPGTHEVVLTT